MKKHNINGALLGILLLLLNYSALIAQSNLSIVAINDCGVKDKQPFLIKGDDYNFVDKEHSGFSKAATTCTYGSSVVYAFDKLDIQTDYYMDLTFLADGERLIQIEADGNNICEPIEVPAWKEVRKQIQLPKKAFAYGQLVLRFEALRGPNAVVSEIVIRSNNAKQLKPFEGDRKEALKQLQAFTVDTTVNVENVLPVYAPFPKSVANVYNPKISLNGIWEFSVSDNGDNWYSIQVPGEWSMQGFQVDSAAFARYRRSFSIPADWEDKVIKLRFDGVHSEYKIFINGQEIGFHEGGMTPYEITIPTDLLKNENELMLYVRSESEADMLGSLTQYAAHQLGGITRKVTLFAVPKVYIKDLRIVTDLDKNYVNAKLKVYVSIENNQSTAAKDVRVNLNLNNHNASISSVIPLIDAGKTWNGWISFDVNAPKLWNNEHPNLYTLNVNLLQDNKETEHIEKRIGFREIEVKGNRLMVNGVPVKLHGVCRHEVHPLTGRVLSEEFWRKDAELYRAGNCNFIRTSHYPPAEEFIEICDELGLFVELESPVCWIGHHANENWQHLNYREPSYYKYVLQANMETMHFYRNHPSIIFWSMANESYWNKEFAQVGEYMKKADITRPYTFHDQAYGGFNNQGSNAPIANIHYPGPNGYKVAAESSRPMTYGEFCHLNVYNRSELETDPGVRSDWALALQPTWENMYKTDGVLGGSIWSGIDDIFQLPDGSAVGYGPWGIIDGWRRMKPEYWDMKKIYSPIRVNTKKLTPTQSLSLEVENRYIYTNLNELKIKWRFGDEEGIVSMNLIPGNVGKLQINIKDLNAANELYIVFEDPRGFVTDEYLIPVGEQSQNSLKTLDKIFTKLKTSKNEYKIFGKDFICIINRNDGQIESLKRNGNEIITGGPWLMALPLNGGGCYPNHNANTPLFNDICSEWKVSETAARETPEGVSIKVSGSYKEFIGSYEILINANGELMVTYDFKALEAVNPRQWGLVFEAPVSFNTSFWRRNGIWSIYPDDHISRAAGEAMLFDPSVPRTVDARTCPTWSWSLDSNKMGSNDFRSTRRNIWYAGLKDSTGRVITVCSDGKQHWRSWLEDNKIRFLVADFVSPGNEMFLESYYASYRKPLKKDDIINGHILLRAE